jgi:hypothetical protein
VKIPGKWSGRSHRARLRADAGSGPIVGCAMTALEPDEKFEEFGDFDPPRITDIGDVYELTVGNSSSGNRDANSQYYW